MHQCRCRIGVEGSVFGRPTTLYPLCNPPPPGGGTVTWPKKHRKYWALKEFYKVLKAPKLIHTVILWYNFVVQPPPPMGGNRECRARSAHTVRTQCKVLYVGKYRNPSFGPLGEHLTRRVRGAEIQPSGPTKHPQFLPQGPLV